MLSRNQKRLSKTQTIYKRNLKPYISRFNLIDNKYDMFTRLAQLQRDVLINTCNPLPRINDKQNKVRLSYSILCLLTDSMQQSMRLSCDKTTSINHAERTPKPLSLSIMTVTRDTSCSIHKRCRATNKTVKQSGFANIGTSDNRHTDREHNVPPMATFSSITLSIFYHNSMFSSACRPCEINRGISDEPFLRQQTRSASYLQLNG